MTDTKETILICARDQYLSEGYAGFSMRKIAEKAGLSATAIYRHFENKEALFHELLRKGFNTYMGYMLPSLEHEQALTRFWATMNNALNFILEQPKFFELIFVKSDTKDQLANNENLRRESKKVFDFMSERITECIEEGVFKKDNSSELTVLLLSTYMGFFTLYTGGMLPREEFEIRRFFISTINRVLTGIAV